jgi:hypothetical protein
MEIAPGEHHTPPLSPTIFHFFPHVAKIRPSSGICQEKKEQKRKKSTIKNLPAGCWVLGREERRIVDPYLRDFDQAAGLAAVE